MRSMKIFLAAASVAAFAYTASLVATEVDTPEVVCTDVETDLTVNCPELPQPTLSPTNVATLACVDNVWKVTGHNCPQLLDGLRQPYPPNGVCPFNKPLEFEDPTSGEPALADYCACTGTPSTSVIPCAIFLGSLLPDVATE